MTETTKPPVQLLITAEYDNVPTSTTNDIEHCNCACYRRLQAKLHALVPNPVNVDVPQFVPESQQGYCTCEEKEKVTKTTQTKETRLISAAELQALCKGKRAKGFPRESEEPYKLCYRCGNRKQKKKKKCKSKCCAKKKKKGCKESCCGPCNVRKEVPTCCKCGKQKTDEIVCPARQPQHQGCCHCCPNCNKKSKCVIM